MLYWLKGGRLKENEMKNPEVIDRFFLKAKYRDEILGIYRLVHNEKEQWVRELIWKNGKWQETDNLIRMLIGLDVDLHEVEMDVIHKVTPEVDTSPYVRI